jgi:hypothetical protein
VWVLKIILFSCVCQFFIDAVVFCDDVTSVCGSYWKFVDLLWQHLYSKHHVLKNMGVFNLLCIMWLALIFQELSACLFSPIISRRIFLLKITSFCSIFVFIIHVSHAYVLVWMLGVLPALPRSSLTSEVSQ